ncbi:MAG: Dyp-type peroxidase [Symplocastrum torsivum CPER-KK1]|jgi:Dyp-type peroxidase family|uniref:Dyp-type peroxidase n=1 Tax=Symplocastrum torsivum CPER-KK1 TaxID=450513 RepID=A0A951PQX3_9CYAN|nr:Dyp-type peroxidase [Symplocastrum torsivum CPER-KK1]
MNDFYRLGKSTKAFLQGFLNTPSLLNVEHLSNSLSDSLVYFEQEPVLDINDIQGNVLAGFSKNFQSLIFLKILEPQNAKSWIKSIEFSIATLEEVLIFKKLYQKIRERRGPHTGTVQSTWINIAFSYSGLRKLVKGVEQFSDSAFREGMHTRSAILGDPTEGNSDGNCNNWLIGSPTSIPDIVVIIASDEKTKLADKVAEVEAGLNSSLRIMFKQQGEAPPPPLTGYEPFGFRDGISQPGIRGRLSKNPEDFLTLRENPDNQNQGKPGQNLLWPGEFVFGYPKQDPIDPLKPGQIADAGPSWAKNGSFLVFRRLRQDIEGFRSFTHSVVAELSKKIPTSSGIKSEEIAAKLMGRWQSGAPILLSPKTDNAAIAEDESINNNFGFKQDVLGLICPHAAHIRKAYPRDDLDTQGAEAAIQTHRLLRRGIPFGEPYPASGERGLLFLAYQTSFERQFEFITRSWMNNPNFRDSNDGYDPIVGQNNNAGENRARTFVLPVQKSDGTIEKISIDLPNDWVIPTGGGYFFAPSISALKYLASN